MAASTHINSKIKPKDVGKYGGDSPERKQGKKYQH
jgi:hypothetical protein